MFHLTSTRLHSIFIAELQEELAVLKAECVKKTSEGKVRLLNEKGEWDHSIGIIYKASFCLPTTTLFTLYFCLVYPILFTAYQYGDQPILLI